jgi:carbonic anhydrase/acetyltransferase-like protein (isoleucine patch superfamily)
MLVFGMNSFGMQATVTQHAQIRKAIEERSMRRGTKSPTSKSLVMGSNAFPDIQLDRRNAPIADSAAETYERLPTAA